LNERPVTRVAVLWSHLSGYLNACLRELDRRGVTVFTSWFRSSSAAPFDEDAFGWLRTKHSREWKDSASIVTPDLIAGLEDFRPEILLVSGWNHPGYRAAARCFRGRAIRVLAMDNPWEERPRQWLGRLIAPWYVRPLFDAAFVPGERQFQFARRLGFADGEIRIGLYAPDTEAFRRPVDAPAQGQGFLFVGRLVEDKGIATLAAGYRRYREVSESPWALTVAGTGPLGRLLEGIPGVEQLGFVQPSALPALMHRHACLVVPSQRENFGVQILEGATAGMAIIATTACGATVHVVRDRLNGNVIPAADPGALSKALAYVERSFKASEFSHASESLARQFTTKIWADEVLSPEFPRGILEVRSHVR